MSLHIPNPGTRRVVIVGGGFGGLNALNQLKDSGLQVVLIDKNNYHTFQPLLYQIATGGLEPDSIAYPFRRYLQNYSNDIYFRMAELIEVVSERNIIRTSEGEIEYDYLVLAMGSETNYFGIKGIKENALILKNVTSALDIRSLVLQNLEKASVISDLSERERLLNFVIIGGGPTGIELAGAIAELKKFVFRKEYKELDMDEMKIVLLEGLDDVLNPFSEEASEKARKFLRDLGVEIKLETMVEAYDGKNIKVKGGGTIPADTLIWTAGVKGKVPKGIPEGLVVKGNRVQIDEYCRMKGSDNIFVIGDMAGMLSDDTPKGHPMIAPVAIQQGETTARNIQKLVSGEPMDEFHYNHRGNLATIGRKRAVADLGSKRFQGAIAWFIWLFVHLLYLVGFRNKVMTLINWFWNYISYSSAYRLIIRKYQKNRINSENAAKSP